MLLRAAAPLAGLDAMRARVPAASATVTCARARAGSARRSAIDRADDGPDLVRGALRIVDDGTAPPGAPAFRPASASRPVAEDLLWRYTVAGDPNLSR